MIDARTDVAKVAIENTAFSFDKPFDYCIPLRLQNEVKKGSCVLVPFGQGNKRRVGFVLDVEYPVDGSSRKLKAVSQVIDDISPVSDELLELALWLKERTFCTIFDAIKAMLPSGMMCRVEDAYEINREDCPETMPEDEDGRRLLEYLLKKKNPVKEEKICKDLGFGDSRTISEMVKGGYIVKNDSALRKTGDLTVRMVRLCDDCCGDDALSKLSPKQKQVVSLLEEIGSASVKEVCYFTGYTSSVIASLEKKKIIEAFDNEVFRNPYPDTENPENVPEIVLTDEQERAYDSLLEQYCSGKAGASLLFGVTGSGKTKVYLKMIDRVISDSKSVILMVPEIALTPQSLAALHERYGRAVAVFHSALSVGERLDEWKRVKRGEAKIVVGTRSAVFAPFENIGLIIIDEEQESTYKSENPPRYNAKDVAKFRCSYHGALLVLASATPSIESYSAAMRGRYTLNVLKQRYGEAALPEVETVDMCLERRKGNPGELSTVLVNSLKDNLEAGYQSILLINRRGYNTYASCVECGHTLTCPSCSIPMTYHHANGRMMCHYCGYSEPFASKCPACGNNSLHYFGFGTQKIEDELTRLLPGSRVLRMDTDTTMSRFSHEKKLASFSKGEYDILLGTQMVAKGLDFENVTLVGVVSVDQQLCNDDYRSLERTFDLLMQVVGRSGRGKHSGRAIIQTMAPENEIIRLAASQDYRTFYETEIEIRRMLVYPPYCDICVIGFVGADELFVTSASKKFLLRLTEVAKQEYSNEKFIALGPMPARISKINNKYRYRLILKARNTALFRQMIAELLAEFGKNNSFSSVTVYADINPESQI